MEVALAAGGAAVFSAFSAALKDPEVASVIRACSTRIRGVVAPNQPEILLTTALKDLPIALDMSRHSLDGSRRGLGADDLRKLAKALIIAPPGLILKLNLSHTPAIGSSNVFATLAEAHTALSALTSLRLRGCALGDGGVIAICRALHHNAANASSRLTELALASNGLSPSAASPIAAAVRELPELQSLDVSHNQIGTAGCALIGDALGERKTLQVLMLASIGLDDAGATRLVGSLSGVPLIEIDLDGNAASNGAMGALVGFASRSHTLSSLRLAANAIGLDGARALAAHLAARTTGPLRTIALANNPLTSAGCEALQRALKSNMSLCELTLTGTGATTDVLLDVGAAVARNREAQRRESRAHTKTLLRAAAAQLADEEAGTGGGTGGAGRGRSAAAAPSTSATPARSSYGAPTAAAAATPAPASSAPSMICGSVASERVRVPGSFDTPAAFACASHAACRQTGGGGGGGATASAPSGAPSAIGSSAWCGGSAPSAAAATSPPRSAASFHPSFAPSGDLSSGVVRQLSTLFVLPSARVVLLDGAGLNDEHAEEIADYLRDNTHTELVHLGGNELTDSGVATIAAALHTCAVRRFSLAGNNMQDDGARALAAALVSGFSPEQLDLSDNMITDEGALSLVARAVAQTPSLRWMDLRLNPLISDEGRASVAASSVGASFDLQL